MDIPIDRWLFVQRTRWLYRGLTVSVYRGSRFIEAQDIEEDPSRLLATGLFRSCRPVVNSPSRRGNFYPTFLQQTRQPPSEQTVEASGDDAESRTGVVASPLKSSQCIASNPFDFDRPIVQSVGRSDEAAVVGGDERESLCVAHI